MSQFARLNQAPMLRKPRLSRPSERDFTPLAWDKFFDGFQDVQIEEDTFRVYTCGNEGPLLVLLHGGGYCGLTWALFTKEILSRIKCKVFAIDIRGHGESHTSEDENLALEIMTKDVLAILSKISANEPAVFIGHSMGGALAVHCAQKYESASTLCVIDVVEGTALESLTSMQSFLRGRPVSFASVESAIQWCYKSGQTHNLDSAKVSMPGQIKNMKTGTLAATEVYKSVPSAGQNSEQGHSSPIIKAPTMVTPVIKEDESFDEQGMKPPSTDSYIWRINLSKTERYWRDWFNGLSQEFLNCPVPKMLLLANIHGLDTTLTVGQMQGKFQMQVLPRCGHAIHEDLPDKVADIIATFLIRHKLTTAVGEFSPMFPAC